MTDQLLGILKVALLGLLYLFFARVLWAVWSEVRGPRPGRPVTVPHGSAHVAAGSQVPGATTGGTADPTLPGQLSDGTLGERPKVVAANRAKRQKRGAASKLVVLVPKERKGASFVIGAEITIGRAPQCRISIQDDSFVSQLHVRLFNQVERTWVEDLGSTNGSYLNGVRLTSVQPFDKGDRLQVGSTVMEGQ